MTLKYESELLFDLMKRDGDDTPSDVLPYESELKEKYLNQVVGAYPKLQDYRPEWLNYNLYHRLPSDFPVESVTNVTSASFHNVVPYAYESAILKGNTGYRDIDTGEFLETFEEGRNLELVSVKMPVLTTSNEDGTKTNILTVNEEAELRGIGDVRDELNLLTGELTQRIGEVVFDGSDDETWHVITSDSGVSLAYVEGYVSAYTYLSNFQVGTSVKLINDKGLSRLPAINTNSEGLCYLNAYIANDALILRINKSKVTNSIREYLQANPITIQYQLANESVKTVDLTVTDQDGNTLSIIRPIEGTMHVNTSSQTLPPLLDMSVPVEATTQNLMTFANIMEEE